MSSHARCDARVAFAGGALLLALAPGVALGQAWLPEKGAFSLSLDFSDVLNKKHYNRFGDEVDVGHTSIEITSLSASYSPSDRIHVSATLPYVNSRHRGSGAGGHNTPIDDGTWHGTVTDLLLTMHYQVADGTTGFAPYVGVLIPTHDYETFGHSAPGRGLEEYWIGFYAARSLNDWIPRTYVQLRGNYAFVEKVLGISHDRSNATLEIGYFINESWSARAIVSQQWTHGGIDVPVPLDSPLFPVHDQLAAEEFVNVGGGVSWAVNDRVSLYGLYMQSIEGTNAHKVDHRVSLGMSYDVGSH